MRTGPDEDELGSGVYRLSSDKKKGSCGGLDFRGKVGSSQEQDKEQTPGIQFLQGHQHWWDTEGSPAEGLCRCPHRLP